MFLLFPLVCASQETGLPLMYWQENAYINFGDYISRLLVERIVGTQLRCFLKKPKTTEKKLLAVGSILSFASENDVVWGSGINGKRTLKTDYSFEHLDVRAVRGPLTRQFLMQNFHIQCPAIYGDPALLFPHFFPEFKRQENPQYDYIVIHHYSEKELFPRTDPRIVYSTDPWHEVLEKILDSQLVISSALHGLVLAEAYGIPARWLRVTEKEPVIKYQDYYLGTNRFKITYASSVEEALKMGGELPVRCDLQKLYKAFPFEFWPDAQFKKPTFFNWRIGS
jgi:pyruvyltransferase